LKEEHINALHKMLNYSQEDGEYFHPHSFDKRYLKRLVNHKYNYYFILKKDDKIIGYSMLRTFGKFRYPTFGGFIHRDYRGMKYGEELLEKTLARAMALGFTKVLLKVDKNNHVAINLYKKIGFSETKKENENIWMEIDV